MSTRQRVWTDKRGRKQTAWLVDIKIDGYARIKRFSPVNSRKGAEQYEHIIRQAILDGTWGKKRVEIPRFKAFAERWLEHSATAAGNKSSTVKAKRDILRAHLGPAFESMLLTEIDAALVDRLKAQKLCEGLSKKTVNNILACLSNLLEIACKWGELEKMPTIEWFHVPRPEVDFLTYEEADRLVRVSEPGRWQTMIKLVLNTGLRIGEVAGLRWDDIDLQAGRMVVRRRVYQGVLDTPKGGRGREVPLNASAVSSLKAWPRSSVAPWVFPQKDLQFIRNPQHACAEAIVRQAALAGLRSIGWHTLRHTFASHLVMQGAPLRVVQELLGHSDYKMTERYAHLAPECRKDAVILLDGVLTMSTGMPETAPTARICEKPVHF